MTLTSPFVEVSRTYENPLGLVPTVNPDPLSVPVYVMIGYVPAAKPPRSVRFNVPLRTRLPFTAIVSLVDPRPKFTLQPVLNVSGPVVKLPALVSVPGDNVPPLATVTDPEMLPVAANVPVEDTLTALVVLVPMRVNNPAEIVVVPV